MASLDLYVTYADEVLYADRITHIYEPQQNLGQRLRLKPIKAPYSFITDRSNAVFFNGLLSSSLLHQGNISVQK